MIPDVLPDIDANRETILCNIFEMEQQQFVRESKQIVSGYFDQVDDMRSFYLTSGGMIEVRRDTASSKGDI